MDETPRQLIRETRVPVPAKLGRPARHDYQYQRCGTCNVFMATERLAGKRMTKVAERKTKIDWAHFLADIAAFHRPATIRAGRRPPPPPRDKGGAAEREW